MLKYQFINYVRRSITTSLNADTGNSFVPTVITGDKNLKALIEDILDNSYGAFGHILGKNTSPIDLNAALKSPVFKDFDVQLVEGEELVSNYDSGIPEGAVT